ncbi:hypothetical protein [Streptomyces albidus (ex Kaewkla and Franco 2022)]|uniref:hypothetical protein n=1 Tax=Streptomyces albidus (ex Kaewkla and Franco 2022) TaxID=722709 RepID=UPI0015EFBB84|nr:hypothetical protein [Streptomyces albidus (ex Kaewkla and Franco 2022)]
MAGKPLKTGMVGGVLALVVALLYSGIGYFTGAVPFPVQKRGEITADEACRSFGDGKRAAAQLEKVLPSRGEYGARGSTPPRASDQDSWEASCFISGDGDRLLYASSELAAYGSAESWLEAPSRDHVGEGGKSHTFQAGEAAVVTERTAEVLVPCVPEGEMPGGAYQLGVVVHAQKPLEGSAEENRRALATLALETARYTHGEAECTQPSKVPAKVTGLS